MRGSDFLEKFGLIAPEYIEEAEEKPKSRKNPWIKWLAAAACLCVIFGLASSGIFYAPPQEPDMGPVEDPGGNPHEGPPGFEYNGMTYLISPHLAASDELPEGFVHAGEISTTGGFENCPYYINPDMPEWIYVYHEVRTNGAVDITGTFIPTEPHNAYVRYVDERLRGADLVCVDGDYYISLWSAKTYGDNPDISNERYETTESTYAIRIEGEPPYGFVSAGIAEFTGYDTVPKGKLASNESASEVYVNPSNRDIIYVSTTWHTSPATGETFHKGYNVYVKYDCPFAK